MDKKKDILWRMYALYIVIVLVGIAIVWKILTIQLIEGDKWRQKAELLSTDTFKVEPTRGNILARDESCLAISVPVYELRMDTKAEKVTDKVWNENVDSLSINLAQLFKDKTSGEYRKMLAQGRRDGNQYLLIKRNATRRELKLVRKFPIFRMGRYKGGLIEIEKTKRVMPYGSLAARTIGKEPTENNKGLGLEQAFNDYLKGEQGLRLMEKLAGGMWRPVDQENTIDPMDGMDIVTTISPQVQDVAASELDRQLTLHNAEHGCVIVMEVQTGDICAIANLKRGTDGKYYESLNYALAEASDPGSTAKLATVMSLLDDGYVTPSTLVETGDGKISYYGHTVHDSHKNGTISVQKAFEVSSNVAMIKLAMQHYGSNPQQFVDHLKKLHLNEPLNTGIPGEATPLIRNKGDEGWSKMSLPSMAFGYEMLVTPMHIITMYNAVANNGKMMKPRFVKEIRNHQTVIKTFEPVVLEEAVCKPSTVAALKTMMEGVVERGTATNLNSTVYKIAGKTGTAQIANNGSGYGADGKMTYRASFCGYFPADNPKYTCIVVVTNPSKDAYYGNVIAGPVFKAVADKVYASSFDINQAYYKTEIAQTRIQSPVSKNGFTTDLTTIMNKLNVTTGGDRGSLFAQTQKAERLVNLREIKIKENTVPDVKGMGARDAVYILENMGMKVIMIGKGSVKEQSIPNGTQINGNETITIILG